MKIDFVRFEDNSSEICQVAMITWKLDYAVKGAKCKAGVEYLEHY